MKKLHSFSNLTAFSLFFVNEAFKHCKPIAATSEGVNFLMSSAIKGIKLAENGTKGELVDDAGVLTMREPSDFNTFNTAFTEAIAQHRHWSREEKDAIPT